MENLDAHIGLALLLALPPAVASAVAAIRAERDATQFESELARFLVRHDESSTTAS
jgi:hypothetical protein